jgi:hypothetical protein
VNSPKLLRTAAAVALVCSFACSRESAAQDKGYWRAASTTASSITGDLGFSSAKITINFTSFPMTQARTLVTSEVAAAFDADVNIGGTGTLYHLVIPATKRFLHHNTLCGTEDTQWVATFASGRTLQVAFFSGSDAPTFTVEALRDSTDLCGTFTYAR